MTLSDRIRRDIEMHISAGEWPPGYRIPFEHELMTEYGCARATVGAALAALVRMGLVERRRKAGSFVAMPHVQSAILDIPDIGAAIALSTGSYHFEMQLSKAFNKNIETTGFGKDCTFRRIIGTHFGADGPFGFESRMINTDAVPLARDYHFGPEAPGAWLLQHIPWSNARHRISAVGADAAIARKLGVPRHTPCLQIERWTWRVGVPITFVRQIFPGERYDLVATFTPQS